jgi:cytochrome b pre-mRNA-processing protein 3
MILATWRARRANRILIEQLHGKIVAAARHPALYTELGAPDTLDGRFEMVALHAGLLMRRLAGAPGVGVDLAQEMADCVFRHFDDGLRELGVGDTSVPKRMKKLAEAFYGRNKAYAAGLAETSDELLTRALARNVYGVPDIAGAPGAASLARYVRDACAALDAQRVEDFAQGEVYFPEPRSAVAQGTAR